jgi:hypothetical protein
VVPLVGLSVVFMSDRWRPDQIVYGRYNDPVLAVVVLLGLAVLLAAGVRRLLVDGTIVLAALATAGLVLWLAKDAELQEAGLLRSMVLGVVGYVGRARLRVLEVTLGAGLVTLGVLAVAVAVRRVARPVVGTVTLMTVSVALGVVGYVRTQPVVDGALNAWARASAVQDAAMLPDGAIVRERIVKSDRVPRSQQRLRQMLYQFYRPTNAFYRDGHTPGGDWTPFVFAPVDDEELRDRGAVIVWRDPLVAIGLLVEPAPD